MNAYQVYEEAIKPLSTGDKLTIARLIMEQITPNITSADSPHAESGFDRLKRLLPQIERVSLTNQDFAGVVLNGPKR